MEIDLCADCGHHYMWLAWCLCGMAYAAWRAGVWILRHDNGRFGRFASGVLWTVAAAIAYMAWRAL